LSDPSDGSPPTTCGDDERSTLLFSLASVISAKAEMQVRVFYTDGSPPPTAGMTEGTRRRPDTHRWDRRNQELLSSAVIPAEAGIQVLCSSDGCPPSTAGMTVARWIPADHCGDDG
jgi:hypothetical protein